MMQKRTTLSFVCSVLLLICLLSACNHSPRKNYFILNTTGNNPAGLPANQNLTNVIGIGPIEISEYINRLPLIYTRADNTLAVAANDYWAEPLDKGIERVLAGNLVGLDNTRSFINFPWRAASKPKYSLRVQIHNLQCTNREASINATWELVDNENKASLQRRHFTRSISARANPEALAQSYSQLLAELAADMNEALLNAP